MKGKFHIPTSVESRIKVVSSSGKTETVKFVGKVGNKTVITSKPIKLPK